jgi:hypothetical protein
MWEMYYGAVAVDQVLLQQLCTRERLGGLLACQDLLSSAGQF